MRSLARTVALFVVSAASVPVAVATTVLASFLFLPLPASLPQPRASAESQTSHILDINGNPIGVFERAAQNIPFSPGDVPKILKEAVISSEDKNFYKHGGVDLRGSARAFWVDLRNQQAVQGGSTITQQLVKNTYTNKKRTIARKVQEAILASQLERQYDKDTILFKYLQAVYLGDRATGVGAAAQTYFRKPITQLTISESALLAGLIPAPSDYEPRGHPQLAEQRRQVVLKKMLEQHYLTPDDYNTALAQQVWSVTAGKPPGPATLIYPPEQQVRKYPYFVDYVEKYLTQKYGEDEVYGGGLTIQTTLDPAVQDAAEKTVANQLKGTRDPLEMGMAAVEPPTGFVKALVGGRDFYSGVNGAQVNLALGGCQHAKPTDKVEVAATCWSHPTASNLGGGSGRQTGSAFKPFTLATAFSEGFLPSKVYSAPSSITIGKYTAHNAEPGSAGSLSLRTATAESVNTVFVQLIRDVGVKQTVEMAKKLGISSAWYSPTEHGLSITLGTLDVAPLDMASAYGVFADRGIRQEPTPVVKVVDAHGKVLEDNTKRAGNRVLDEVIADNVTDLLRGVITGGTGTAANIGRPAAGKTGTGENFTNAWFVGYTPTLSTSVWMGYADTNNHPLLGIRGFAKVYGGTIPARTWHDFMSVALKDVPVTDFNQPAPLKPLADAIARIARGGFDPGTQRSLTNTDPGGPYDVEPPPPVAEPPPTTTTTEPTFGGGGGGTTTTTPSFVPRP
jgi:penicillin-binding protein 1A